MKRLLPLLLALAFTIPQWFVLPGCANIIPPAGGPRDSIAPVLVKATPGDSTRNFSGNKFMLVFDEFVEVQNISENLLVSPLPKVNPLVEFKLNTVTVKIKDTLEPNTTYTFQFGNSIKDFNEGNILKKFSYVLSTGPTIDSLELQGQVLLAESGKVDSTLIVMLHTNGDDSAVVKEKPRYITRLDGEGKFLFRNLPGRTFYLYALKDEGGTRRFMDDKQLFAFAAKPVTIQAGLSPVTLYAYSAKPPAPAATATPANIGGGLRLRGGGGGATNDKRLRYQTSLAAGQQDLLNDLMVTFESPLRRYDSGGIRLFTDSTYIPVTDARFVLDSSRQKLTLKQSWKENTRYHIILSKEFAEDSTGRKLLKDDTLHFQTRKLADYGTLKIRFRNLDLAANPVLLFMSGETITRSVALTGPEYSAPLVLPTEYELRLLFDTNKNGKWDPGQFFGKHLQPEIVRPIGRKITIKANWQNEFDIEAPAPPLQKN